MLLVGWAISKQASPVAMKLIVKRADPLIPRCHAIAISCKHLLHFSITQ